MDNINKETIKRKMDFIGVGFQRCATSWLNYMLYDHPEICKPKSGLHFFNVHYDKGINWYLKVILENCKSSSNLTRIGEFCTTYSYPEVHKTVIKRISKNFPDVKILINIRNPIERVNSEYLRLLRRNEIKNIGLKNALSSHPEIVKRGFYYQIIKDYQTTFGIKNIHVSLFDDILKKPENILKFTYRFIGVDEHFLPNGFKEKKGSTYNPKSYYLERLFQLLQKAGKITYFDSLFYPVRFQMKKAIKLLRIANTRTENLDKDVKKYLIGIYRDDILSTQNIIGTDLSSWLD